MSLTVSPDSLPPVWGLSPLREKNSLTVSMLTIVVAITSLLEQPGMQQYLASVLTLFLHLGMKLLVPIWLTSFLQGRYRQLSTVILRDGSYSWRCSRRVGSFQVFGWSTLIGSPFYRAHKVDMNLCEHSMLQHAPEFQTQILVHS